jgi:large subunit ribosomal protein L24
LQGRFKSDGRKLPRSLRVFIKMKKKFSTAWEGSSQPRKQRKFRANAPLHLRKKFVSVNLSKSLREKLGKRNLQVKKGDIVKIMKGKYKGKQGKILEVNLKLSKVFVEGMQATKQDGSKVNVKLQPSNLQIIELSERKTKNQTSKKEVSEEKIEKKTESKNKKMETKK